MAPAQGHVLRPERLPRRHELIGRIADWPARVEVDLLEALYRAGVFLSYRSRALSMDGKFSPAQSQMLLKIG